MLCSITCSGGLFTTVGQLFHYQHAHVITAVVLTVVVPSLFRCTIGSDYTIGMPMLPLWWCQHMPYAGTTMAQTIRKKSALGVQD